MWVLNVVVSLNTGSVSRRRPRNMGTSDPDMTVVIVVGATPLVAVVVVVVKVDGIVAPTVVTVDVEGVVIPTVVTIGLTLSMVEVLTKRVLETRPNRVIQSRLLICSSSLLESDIQISKTRS